MAEYRSNIILARLGLVSSTFSIVQILVHLHFDQVSSVLALNAIEKGSPEKVSQMITEMVFQYSKKDKCKRYIFSSKNQNIFF